MIRRRRAIDIATLEELAREHPRASNELLGKMLAQKEGRRTPYHSQSISTAFRRWHKREAAR